MSEMSMTCEEVRDRIDEPSDPAVAAHLTVCAFCRAEAELSRRLASAMAGLPRVPAPPQLADTIMAELVSPTPSARVSRRSPPFALHPLEVGALGALCVIVLLAARALISPWISDTAAGAASWLRRLPVPQPISGGVFSLREALDHLIQLLPDPAAFFPGGLSSWAWGLAAFTVALFFLLSWREGGGRRHGTEEAHG